MWLKGSKTSPVAQMVKCLPTTRETWVRSLGWEDLVEKEMATHSSTLAWKITWTEEPGRLQSTGSWRVGHNWATFTLLSQEDRQGSPGAGCTRAVARALESDAWPGRKWSNGRQSKYEVPWGTRRKPGEPVGAKVGGKLEGKGRESFLRRGGYSRRW